MPGPCNLKKKKKQLVKKGRKPTLIRLSPSVPYVGTTRKYDKVQVDIIPLDVVPVNIPSDTHGLCHSDHEESKDGIMPQRPYIHDPGNGPRVRDTYAFLSSFFAQPPTLDDPLCAEFAQGEVLQMLCTVLPEEAAHVLWYNKSRATGRICPACRRLYCLGDILPDLIRDDGGPPAERSPLLAREQKISGLCSPVCFILASFEHPASIKTTWGRTAEEMDNFTWQLLNGPGDGNGDRSLSLLLKMSRLDDLGLGQLCLPDLDFESMQDDRSEI